MYQAYNKSIGVIGYGTWATALVHLLTQNGCSINWWVRHTDIKKHLSQYHRNPRYLTQAVLPVKNLNVSTLLDNVIQQSDILVICLPAAYVHLHLQRLSSGALINRTIISTIKGLEITSECIMSEYFQKYWEVKPENYLMLGGPSHAEEVIRFQSTFLTFATVNPNLYNSVTCLFNNNYIHTRFTQDVLTQEYGAILKNIYAIGAGIIIGLQKGDNYLAVYLASAAHEMQAFIRKLHSDTSVLCSALLGDLLVTGYSMHSRNRYLGQLLGEGMPIDQALIANRMIAEGYLAAKIIKHKFPDIEAPIIDGIYQILYRKMPAGNIFTALESIYR